MNIRDRHFTLNRCHPDNLWMIQLEVPGIATSSHSGLVNIGTSGSTEEKNVQCKADGV